jgi:hypothetical protein
MKIRVALLCALLPSLAAADERGAFVSLDRQGTDSAVGLAVSGHFFAEDEGPDAALRENLYGRFVDRSGFGGYGQVSLSHAFADGETYNAVSGVELGALYVLRAGDADLILRLGFGLPTASDSFEGIATNAFAILDRVHDVALIVPNTVWIRPGVAARFGKPAFFAQLDAGVDIPIETEDGAGASDVIMHANAGVGTRQGPVTLTAELANHIVENDGLDAVHSLAASVRYTAATIQPYAAYTFTFTTEGDGDSAHAVTAGVQSSF